MPSERVMVGMSGGVDSSVAALLLLEEGYEVEGLFMKNWEEDDGTEYCTAKADLEDAQRVCATLGIPLHEANFAAEYWDRVFEHFLHEYRAGRTPNPDILCNREIKFNAFLEYALALGAERIATGHYARLLERDGRTLLAKAKDDDKDQTYFLHEVSESRFAKTLCPLGELRKPEVREMAKRRGLATHDKQDSTGICFIGERRFRDFLERYIPAQPGPIEGVGGEQLGSHSGLMFHTLGQRQGLGIGGLSGHPEAPWYVVGKDVARNVLIVAQGNDHPALFSTSLRCREIHWIDGEGPALPFRGACKTRYRQPDQAVTLTRDGEGGYLAEFDRPQRAVTPGQSACFYSGEICLGGGVIEATAITRGGVATPAHPPTATGDPR